MNDYNQTQIERLYFIGNTIVFTIYCIFLVHLAYRLYGTIKNKSGNFIKKTHICILVVVLSRMLFTFSNVIMYFTIKKQYQNNSSKDSFQSDWNRYWNNLMIALPYISFFVLIGYVGREFLLIYINVTYHEKHSLLYDNQDKQQVDGKKIMIKVCQLVLDLIQIAALVYYLVDPGFLSLFWMLLGSTFIQAIVILISGYLLQNVLQQQKQVEIRWFFIILFLILFSKTIVILAQMIFYLKNDQKYIEIQVLESQEYNLLSQILFTLLIIFFYLLFELLPCHYILSIIKPVEIDQYSEDNIKMIEKSQHSSSVQQQMDSQQISSQTLSVDKLRSIVDNNN